MADGEVATKVRPRTAYAGGQCNLNPPFIVSGKERPDGTL